MLKLITFLENLKAEPRRLTDEENLYLDQIGDELRRAESDAARWRILEREASWLPPWRELLREYQRLEARGEIRGGRFLSGVVGQQFALPEAVAALRSVRKRAHDGAMIVVSAADPLNLLGGIVAGDKVPRQPGARLLLRDGVRARNTPCGWRCCAIRPRSPARCRQPVRGRRRIRWACIADAANDNAALRRRWLVASGRGYFEVRPRFSSRGSIFAS